MDNALKIALVLLSLLFGLIAFCAYWALKCKNPYKLVLIIGKRGSGKTTFLAKTAIKAMRKGKKVYTNFYLPGAIIIEPKDIGYYCFEPNSIVMIDEAGIIWNNRKFKTFDDAVNQWYKYSRQYRNTIYIASQADDVDAKIRLLIDRLYLCQCKMGFLSVARRVKRQIVVVQPSADAEGRIADGMELEPIWLSLFGVKTMMVTFIPKWTKFFKSFNPPYLPPINGTYQTIPDKLKRYYMTKRERKLDKRRMVKNRIRKWFNRFRRKRKNTVL